MKSFRATILLSILIQFAQPQYYDEEFWEPSPSIQLGKLKKNTKYQSLATNDDDYLIFQFKSKPRHDGYELNRTNK